MTIRRYLKSDIPRMIEQSKLAVMDYHYQSIYYDEGKVSDMLVGGLKNPDFFCDVIEHNGEVGGALVAKMIEFIHSREAFAQDLILYVIPEARNLKDMNALIRSYIAWAHTRRAKQIRLDQSTGFKMDKFAILAKRAGFSQIGTKWNMEVKG